MITMIQTLAANFLAVANPDALANAAKVTNITDGLRAFLAPIVMLIISAVAISFLLKREMKKFIQFAVLTIGVGVFFYVPGIVESLAKMVAGLFSGA